MVAKKISVFQQVLLVQATRPDRLQSAMSLFACRCLGRGLCFRLGQSGEVVKPPACFIISGKKLSLGIKLYKAENVIHLTFFLQIYNN